MDIFQFAAEKEKYSEHFYRDLAKRTDYVGLRNILTMLADEEVKHVHVVEQMKAETPVEVPQTPILTHTRKIFEKMRGSSRKFNFDISEADLYRKACDIEEDSKRFYLEKAEEVEDPAQKEIFRKLADEEQKHWTIVDNLRNFVARPETFLENAEFFHYDDYVGGVF
ncbi:MAG: ferritin family protein [Sedimentisphaerales bacterium]|nr:ferritin family protein [Sedimentisphaerales bacterium]